MPAETIGMTSIVLVISWMMRSGLMGVSSLNYLYNMDCELYDRALFA